MNVYRLAKSLRQVGKDEMEKSRAQKTAELTMRLVGYCGEYSQGKQMIFRIGKALLSADVPKVRVPVCMDYGNLDGNIPPIALRHIEFLRRCFEETECSVEFLIPNQEVDDRTLREAVKLSPLGFLEILHSSEKKLREVVGKYGWSVTKMTSALPWIPEKERVHREQISSDSTQRPRIVSDTMSRNSLYDRTMPSMNGIQRMERTIRTAAQYLALGDVSAETGHLLCNHTTTNLSWYGKTGVGVLHNPVSLHE